MSRIMAGEEFGEIIDRQIQTADVILLLVSPDFIASDYCYQREMSQALERHGRGEAKVIPVILRPCDWHDLPFGKLLAVPNDGRPITMWPNLDQAFLDVVTAIKKALQELGKRTAQSSTVPVAVPLAASGPSRPMPRSSNLGIKKQFTDLDMDQFRHDGFEYIAKYFENSLDELVKRNPGLARTFRRIDANRFTVAAYREGEKICKGSASIGGGMLGGDGIEYAMTDDAGSGGMNEALSVEADDRMLYFKPMGMQSHRSGEKEKLTFEGAAELFWELFIQPLQR